MNDRSIGAKYNIKKELIVKLFYFFKILKFHHLKLDKNPLLSLRNKEKFMPSFDFDNTESKLLNTLCSQSLKQFGSSSNPGVKQAVELLSNISYKLGKFKGKRINLTKQEHEFIKRAVTENVTNLNKQMKEVWFGKRWIMKMMSKQYTGLAAKLR